ncbi:MAG TPA: response regulator transcription factor [Verrucomicrobiae bacterium]|nr:response regulator transcription factor [Verrucomicrobiae bacterium]
MHTNHSKESIKLLIVEDNESLVSRLQNYMNRQFALDVVHTAADAIKQIGSRDYDIIVLDLGLPDDSGEAVCRVARDKGITTPILILTGENAVDSKVRLLETGADDYLTKPFKLQELQARLGALLRRTKGAPYILVLGDLTIDLEGRRVKRGNKEIMLRRKEFDILQYLALNRGRIITRPMIMEHVWDEDKENWNNIVDVHIKHLRDKVDRPFKTPLIKTAHGLGYMLDA